VCNGTFTFVFFSKNVSVASSPYRIEAGEAKDVLEKVR